MSTGARLDTATVQPHSANTTTATASKVKRCERSDEEEEEEKLNRTENECIKFQGARWAGDITFVVRSRIPHLRDQMLARRVRYNVLQPPSPSP